MCGLHTQVSRIPQNSARCRTDFYWLTRGTRGHASLFIGLFCITNFLCNKRRVKIARNNLSTLQGLNAQPGLTVTVRVDTGPPPARLQHTADRAAHSGDLRSMHPADLASHVRAKWDELRVWDPGD